MDKNNKIGRIVIAWMTILFLLGGCVRENASSNENITMRKIFDMDELGNPGENIRWSIISIKETYLIAEERFTTLDHDFTKRVVKVDLQTKEVIDLARFEDKKVVIMSAEVSVDGTYVAGYRLDETTEGKILIKTFIGYSNNKEYEIIYENQIETVFNTDLLYEHFGKVYAFIDSQDESNESTSLGCSEIVRFDGSIMSTVYKECEGFSPKALKNMRISESGFLIHEIRENKANTEFKSVAVGFDGKVRGQVTYVDPVSVFIELDGKLVTTYWDVEDLESKTNVSMIDVSSLNGGNKKTSRLFTPKDAERPNIVYGCGILDTKTMLCNTAYNLEEPEQFVTASIPYLVTINGYDLEFEKLPVGDEYPNHIFVNVSDGIAYMGTYVTKGEWRLVYTIFEIRKGTSK